jgi:hypothetical protein
MFFEFGKKEKKHLVEGELTAMCLVKSRLSVYSMAAVSDKTMSTDICEDEEKKQATHDHFKDIEEVRQLIDSLKDVWNDLRAEEIACERFTGL